MPRRCPSKKTTTTIVTAKIEDRIKAKNRLRHGGIRDEKKCAFTGSFSNSGFIPSISRNAYTVIGSLDASPGLVMADPQRGVEGRFRGHVQRCTSGSSNLNS